MYKYYINIDFHIFFTQTTLKFLQTKKKKKIHENNILLENKLYASVCMYVYRILPYIYNFIIEKLVYKYSYILYKFFKNKFSFRVAKLCTLAEANNKIKKNAFKRTKLILN